MESDEQNYKQCLRDWGCLAVRVVTKVKRRLGPALAPKIWRRAQRYGYCCGLTVPSQVVIAVMLKRTTPSS